jgi:hypothetical protein
MRIGFDFDGVLCMTPFGRLAVHAPQPVAPLPENYADLYDDGEPPGGVARLAVEWLRFGWRRMNPHARETLRTLAAQHELHIVTGRSVSGLRLMGHWLRSRGLDGYISGIHMAPEGLRPPQHKLAIAKTLGIGVHIDDDPRTAWHLAANGVPAYLLDHANAHGDETPPAGVTLIRSLGEFVAGVQGEGRA